MDISIEPSSESPIYAQIVRQIASDIDKGILEEGSALPSIRGLAAELQISTVTVKRAYDELESRGHIETTLGKGSYVSKRRGSVDAGVTSWKAFWSYSRRDDELSRGRVSQLADDIAAEYELQTGDRIDLFKDTESIGWGDSWPQAIEENLNSTVFFIPVLTPTYLRRPACLGELKTAHRRLSELGLDRMIFPIRYADISSFLDNSPDNDLVELIKGTQHNDWTSLRNKDRDSEPYRTGVEKIVFEMIRIDKELTANQKQIESTAASTCPDDLEEDDAPSFLEDLAMLEVGMVEFEATTGDLTAIIEDIGAIAVRNTEKLEECDKKKGGFAGRLAVSQNMAKELEAPAENLVEKCSVFTTIVNKMDQGISTYISLAVDGVKSGTEDSESIKEFFRSIKTLSDSAAETFEKTKGFSDSVSFIEKFARELRAPARKIRAAITDFNSNESTISGWGKLIDASGIDYAAESKEEK